MHNKLIYHWHQFAILDNYATFDGRQSTRSTCDQQYEFDLIVLWHRMRICDITHIHVAFKSGFDLWHTYLQQCVNKKESNKTEWKKENWKHLVLGELWQIIVSSSKRMEHVFKQNAFCVLVYVKHRYKNERMINQYQRWIRMKNYLFIYHNYNVRWLKFLFIEIILSLKYDWINK